VLIEVIVKKVLVVVNKMLLGAGLESLLSQDTELFVRNISFESESSLRDEIVSYKPNVVIIEKNANERLPVSVCSLLASNPRIRFLLVDSLENNVSVYEKQDIQIAHSLDLISMVKT
jgi:hypothetical protein